MYRIKFDKDLKELEKYGYEEDKQGNYSKKVMKDTNKAWAYYETIEINKKDRIIRTRLYQDAADQEWIGYIEKTGRFIYDLEDAGLLEEVKDEKSNIVLFAENELNIILKKCKDDKEAEEMQKHMNNDILEIVKTFADQGHSGFSANYAINLIEKLLRYEPITPLTGDDSEWNKLEYGKSMEYQNKRCPRIFKDADGKPYDVEGRIFSEDNGQTWYTSKDSRVYIDFPYIPKTEKVILNRKNEVGE